MPGKRIEEASDSSCILHLARGGGGDIAQWVSIRSWKWGVGLSNCTGDNDSILYLNLWLTFLSNGEED
jgi:hypothetical protein